MIEKTLFSVINNNKKSRENGINIEYFMDRVMTFISFWILV